jgi:hypothetical protein
MGYEICSMRKGRAGEVLRKLSCYQQIKRVAMFTYETLLLQLRRTTLFGVMTAVQKIWQAGSYIKTKYGRLEGKQKQNMAGWKVHKNKIWQAGR